MHPATASGHPVPLQFLTKGATRTCCGSFWSSVRLCVGVYVGPCVLRVPGPGPPCSTLTVGSSEQGPWRPGPALPSGLARSRLCSLLCPCPASPPCPGCWGTEPPGPSLWGGQPSQLGLRCRPGMVGTVGKRGSPTSASPSSGCWRRKEEAWRPPGGSPASPTPSQLLLTLGLSLSPACSEQREASGALGSFSCPLLPGS